MVAGTHEQRTPIGGEYNRMRTMLSATSDTPQKFDGVELVVTIGVPHPVQPRFKRRGVLAAALHVRHDIQAVERVEQPMRHPEIDVDRLDLSVACFPHRGDRDPIQFPVLIRHDQPPLRVDRHRHPRPLDISRHRVQPLDPETGQRVDLVFRRGGGLCVSLQRHALNDRADRHSEGQQLQQATDVAMDHKASR